MSTSLKSALLHAGAIDQIRKYEEEQKAHEIAEEQRRAQKRQTEKINRTRTLYSWTVTPEAYHMEFGVAFADDQGEVYEKLKEMYPDALFYKVSPVDYSESVQIIGSYIE